MSKVIREYYEEAGVQPFLFEEKIQKLNNNSDILQEFEDWIQNHKYVDGIKVEGYSASEIASLSPYLEGEGTFMLLIELRENPEKAKKRIENGFKIK